MLLFLKVFINFTNAALSDEISEHLSEKYIPEIEPSQSMDIKKDVVLEDMNKDYSIPEVVYSVYYESILPINSFLFLMEINNMDISTITSLANKINIENARYFSSLKVSDDELKQKIGNMLSIFCNFSKKIDLPISQKLIKAMELRNEYFEKDKSQQAKKLYMDDMAVLKEKFNNMKTGNNPFRVENLNKKNDKFVKMLKSFRMSIVESKNILKAVDRERREFIGEFVFSDKKSASLKQEAFMETRIQFNLGGSFFAPNVFLKISRGIIMSGKRDMLEKAINTLLKPIESLELVTRIKSNTEKKEDIIEFLNLCLKKMPSRYSDEIDDAFKVRSSILELYFRDESEDVIISKEGMLDRFQESYIKKMIQQLKETNEDMFQDFIVLNRDILTKYIDLLDTGGEKDQKELLKMFKNRTK